MNNRLRTILIAACAVMLLFSCLPQAATVITRTSRDRKIHASMPVMPEIERHFAGWTGDLQIEALRIGQANVLKLLVTVDDLVDLDHLAALDRLIEDAKAAPWFDVDRFYIDVVETDGMRRFAVDLLAGDGAYQTAYFETPDRLADEQAPSETAPDSYEAELNGIRLTLSGIRIESEGDIHRLFFTLAYENTRRAGAISPFWHVRTDIRQHDESLAQVDFETDDVRFTQIEPGDTLGGVRYGAVLSDMSVITVRFDSFDYSEHAEITLDPSVYVDAD